MEQIFEGFRKFIELPYNISIAVLAAIVWTNVFLIPYYTTSGFLLISYLIFILAILNVGALFVGAVIGKYINCRLAACMNIFILLLAVVTVQSMYSIIQYVSAFLIWPITIFFSFYLLKRLALTK